MDKISSEILSAVILTFNEENNIGRVLDKLNWLEKIIIIDSFSTDNTLHILARYSNAEVHGRKFDTHAMQWNFGLNLCNSQWVLSLDADYVLQDNFIEEIKDKIKDLNFAAYDSGFNFLVFGKPLRSNNTTPRPVLFQKKLCKYFDEGHTQRLQVDGKTGKFINKIDHDDRKPLSRWLANQANYSIRESDMLINTSNKELSFTSKIRKTKIFAPFFIFFYCLFVQGLILSGWRGWHYTLQRTIVEMLFALRLIEHDDLSR